MLALMAALPEEFGPLRSALVAPVVHHHAGREFITGQLDGRDAVLVLARIGKVAAAITATLLIERFGAQAIIFTGVAGGLHRDARVGDVVIARELLQHDLDASPLFPRHEVPLTGCSRLAADVELADALAAAARDAMAIESQALSASWSALGIHAPRVHLGLVLSGDRFVATAGESEALRHELPDALAVEMEGAAVAQVCHDCDVPFAVLRAISDRADEQAHLDFGRFLREVAGPLGTAIVRRWLFAGAVGWPRG
jgi:adenosylhomocysteine nucleosidase